MNREDQQHLANRLAERADQLTETAERWASQSSRRAQTAIQSRPMLSTWASFGIGVGVGLALAALIPLPEREEPWWDDVNETWHGLSRQARDLGHDVAHRTRRTWDRMASRF